MSGLSAADVLAVHGAAFTDPDHDPVRRLIAPDGLPAAIVGRYLSSRGLIWAVHAGRGATPITGVAAGPDDATACCWAALEAIPASTLEA